jgi:hypothetical protein
MSAAGEQWLSASGPTRASSGRRAPQGWPVGPKRSVRIRCGSNPD